jgi:monofunctional biosynthetic peptidoglycan transglycosylase
MNYRLFFNGITPKKQIHASSQAVRRRYLNLIVSMEDPLFYQHNGIDLDSMRSAARVNHRYKKIISGASTIDQQLARTLFLFPDKLYLRKYLEVIAAIIMDATISKERILELYVNYAEWGRGIYGINSASWYYYKKPISSCSDDQIVRLITVLPSPVLYSPFNFERRERLTTRYYRLQEALGM